MRNFKLPFGLLFLCILCLLSCKKEKPIDNTGGDKPLSITTEKTDVSTYEMVNLVVSGEFQEQYTATFGQHSIKLVKSSDTTLSFIVPEVTADNYTLESELGALTYTVKETQVSSPEVLVQNIATKVDKQINDLETNNPNQLTAISELKKYKQEVIDLFSSMTVEEKRQTALIYEANKAIIQGLSDKIYTIIDDSTTMNKGPQSACPTTNFKSFYFCTAENMGAIAADLSHSIKEITKLFALAGISASLAPASLGLSASGTVLALGAAGIIFTTEIAPAWKNYQIHVEQFIAAQWIFSQSLFITLKKEFTSNTVADLDIDARFLALSKDDASLSPETGFFIDAYSTLTTYWQKFTSLFGDAPAFTSNEKAIELQTGDLQVSNIDNPKVQLSALSGEKIQFKSTSTQVETFAYTITAQKEGFTETKTITATIQPRVQQILSLQAEGATHQVGVGGSLLPEPVKVKVVNQNGDPVEGKEVVWEIIEGKGGFITPSSLTDANGIAKANWSIEDNCHAYRGSNGNVDGQLVKASIKPEGDSIPYGKDRVLFTSNKGYLTLRVTGDLIGNDPATGSITVNIQGVTSETFSFTNLSQLTAYDMTFELPEILSKNYTATFTCNANRQIYFKVSSECRSFVIKEIDKSEGIPTPYSLGWRIESGQGSKQAEFIH